MLLLLIKWLHSLLSVWCLTRVQTPISYSGHQSQLPGLPRPLRKKKREREREVVGSLSGPAKLTEFVTPCKTKAYRYQRLNPDDGINRKLSDQKMKNDQCR